MKTLKLIIHAFRDLIVRYLPNFNKNKHAFAFLVHPRDISDVYRKYPFAKYAPKKILLWVLRHYWPVVLSQVEGLKSKKTGEEVKGYIMTIPLTAQQMINNHQLAQKKIIQALKLAEKLGVKIFGLGALTASITKGGLDLTSKTKIVVTTGNSLTVAVAVKSIKDILRKKQLSFPKTVIAIIGATGSIGRGVALLLAAQYPKNLILIGRTPAHLTELKNAICTNHTRINLVISTEVAQIQNADIIIVATASPEVLIKSEYLKQGAIIYDVSQPQNVSPDIIQKRADVSIIDGGIVSTPGINYHFNFGLPRETAFACLTETMILAAEKKTENHVGAVILEKAKEIYKLAKIYNFKSWFL
jgi:predicted amino acid dehydrogenase